MSEVYEIEAVLRLRASSAEEAQRIIERHLGNVLWCNDRPKVLAEGSPSLESDDHSWPSESDVKTCMEIPWAEGEDLP